MKKLIFLIVLALVLTTVPGFLSVNKAEAATTPTFQRVAFVNATVTATMLNVRQGPAKTFPVVCRVKKGQTVKIFGKLGNWYAIQEAKTGCVGCASATYIKTAGATTGVTKPPVATTPGTTTTTPSMAGVSSDEQAMLNLVNKARASAGAGPLAFDTNVQKTARLKAQDMVNSNYFSHQSPTYGSPFDMMRQFGISFRSAGENIAGNQTVDRAFNAWMNSPGHKQNILNSGFNYTGIGIVSSPTYGKIFVQQFIGR